MSESRSIEDLAAQLLSGQLTRMQFQAASWSLQVEEQTGASLDLDRRDRCGYPEVIFGLGKPLSILIDIVDSMRARNLPVLITRVEPTVAEELRHRHTTFIYNEMGRTLRSRESCADAKRNPGAGSTNWVAVVAAGSSDVPVAEEARETLAWMGIDHTLFRDIGVAGPQRLLQHVGRLQSASAIVVIAGMEGALPSVVAGHVGCPVFAVPTSVGYGAHLGGLAPLLAMLNSCAANVAVCNIDAGFKGAYLAGLVAARSATARESSEAALQTRR
jgi:hypothetical protein